MQYYESPAYGKWCERVYGMDLKQMGMVTKEELDLFFRELPLPPSPVILDVGCGPGHLTAAVTEHYKNASVLGVDIDERAIEHAMKAFPAEGSPVFRVLNGTALLSLDRKFDLINFFDALYFTQTSERLKELLDDCFRLLKPDGKIVVTWTNRPDERFSIFNMEGDGGWDTQVAAWGKERAVKCRMFDLTAKHRRFWQKAEEELHAMRDQIYPEVPKIYEQLEKQCAYFTGLCEKSPCKLFRYLYIFEKNES